MERMTWAQLKRTRQDGPGAQAEYTRAIAALSFGSQVRVRRQSNGLSETELAERIGTDPETVERIELGDVDVAPSILRRAAALLGIDRDIVPGGGGPSSPNAAQSFLLIAYLVNALGEEYHAYFTLIASPLPDGFLVRSSLEGEMIFQTTSRDELIRVATQRVAGLVTEAGNAGVLPSLLAERGITLYKGPPPGSQQEAPPRPRQGWSVQLAAAAA